MMICTVSADNIRGALDWLAGEYTILDEDILPIQQDVERLEEDLQSRIDDLENENEELTSHVEELENENEELTSHVEELETSSSFSNFENFVSSLLRSVGSDEPSLGTVLALKDDIKKLLVEKYHISEVSL